MSNQQIRSGSGDSGRVQPESRPARWWFRKAIGAGVSIGVGLTIIALVGVAQRIGWIQAGGPVAANTGAASDQIYTCSMHPQIRQPSPGRCPICGMELVVATGAATDLNELSVNIEPAQRRLAQIETVPVERKPVTDEIRSIGMIAIDESRMATIPSYIAGRVERLFADYTGVDVAKGDHLAVIYSPQLFSVQVEYLEARKGLTSLGPNAIEIVRQTQQKLIESSRQRLAELGMTLLQISELEKSGEAQSRLTIYSPTGGTVIEKLKVEGDYLDAGEPIYRIANLSTIWLMLELFPEDASRIRFGQVVLAEVHSLPGEIIQGRVAFIDPTVDPRKRTVGVRVEFLNEAKRLRPGDYASATIRTPIGPTGNVYDAGLAGKWISPMHPQIIRDEPGDCPICGMELVSTARFGYSEEPLPQATSLVVPRSAVLMAGNHSVLYVEERPGRFEIRPVTIGAILRDQVVILDGVAEGEMVASAGNFLIDSQMQLAGKPSLIDPTRAIAARKERNTPIPLSQIHVTPVPGEAGKQLEQLFQAYFRIQQSLADDRPPSESDAVELNRLANVLASNSSLPDTAAGYLGDVAGASEHLHHLPLEEARLKAFRPISHAIVQLGALVRGEGADQSFVHLFCPMVKGGAGDWLQTSSDLRNPYWGSQMLTCGEVVHHLPIKGHVAAPAEDPKPSDENGTTPPDQEAN